MRSLVAAVALIGASCAASPFAHAVSGTVVNSKGQALVGARVCYFVERLELMCTLTEAQGRFELPTSEIDTLRAIADGYMPREFVGSSLAGPVVLAPAPSLIVRLVDRGTGASIEKGEVLVVYPSGKEKGPFPANAAGVKVQRVLDEGEIRVIGKAEGYRDSPAETVHLVGGEETHIVLKLDPVKR